MNTVNKLEDRYSLSIVYALRQRAGLDKHDESMDDRFLRMDKSDVLHEVMEWNGLLGGWDYTIKDWIKSIYGIDLDNK